MSNKSSQKKKNESPSFDNTRIALQFLVVIVGAIAGNAGYAIIIEVSNAIVELRPAIINPAEVLIFLIFSALLISLLRLLILSARDDTLIEQADAIIQELEDNKINRLAEPDSTIKQLQHENEILKRRLAEIDPTFDDVDQQDHD